MRDLAAHFFLPSLPLTLTPVEHVSDVKSSGEYDVDGYCDIVTHKTQCIINVLKQLNEDECFIWSDVDVIFFQDFAHIFKQSMEFYDLAFQRESDDYFLWSDNLNTGFIFIKNTKLVRKFFEDILLLQLTGPERKQQRCLHNVLRRGEYAGLRIKLLPTTFASTANDGLNKHKQECYLHHAAGCFGLRAKNNDMVNVIGLYTQYITGREDYKL